MRESQQSSKLEQLNRNVDRQVDQFGKDKRMADGLLVNEEGWQWDSYLLRKHVSSATLHRTRRLVLNESVGTKGASAYHL